MSRHDDNRPFDPSTPRDAELDFLWRELGHLDEDVPSDALRGRFHALLDAYRAGVESTPRRPSLVARFELFLDAWWPRRPSVQFAMVATTLLLALATHLIAPSSSPKHTDELDELRTEIASLHHLVGQTLLTRGETAVDRLRGAQLSRRAAPDDELVATLRRVALEDSSDNVRLAAVDALVLWADRENVRAALRDALRDQDSVLVQLTLAELLDAIDHPESREVFRELLAREQLDSTVREFLRERLGDSI